MGNLIHGQTVIAARQNAVLTGELTRMTAVPLVVCFLVAALAALVIHLLHAK